MVNMCQELHPIVKFVVFLLKTAALNKLWRAQYFSVQRSFDVLWRFQRCFKEVLRCFMGTLGKFQGYFKSVSHVIQTRVKRPFKQVLRGVTRRFLVRVF